MSFHPSRTKPLVIGFAARSGSGKTFFLTRLIPRLRSKGLRIGVIKHAHAGFDIDYPGKDSYELRKAGATQTLVASTHRQALIIEREPPREADIDELLNCLDTSALDLVLVEGFRHLTFPKIEIHRSALGKPPLFHDDPTIIALITDAPTETRLPRFGLEAVDQVVEFLLSRIEREIATR